MTQTDSHPDMFAPPAADAARPVGLIEGPPGWREGFGAGLRCWCGPAIGWRDFRDLVGEVPSVIVHQHGRLMVSLTWDLGPHRFPRRKAEDAG
jgi:hypothetical protein